MFTTIAVLSNQVYGVSMQRLIKVGILLGLFCVSAVSMANNYVIGQLIPFRSVTLSSEITGIVDQFSKDVGDEVQTGEVLVKLSIKDNELNVSLAKAQLNLSLNELEIQNKQLVRYQKLYKSKGISISEFDEQRRKTNSSRSQYEVDKIKLQIAQRQKDKSQLKAPFSGFVLTRNVELGQLIPSGQSLYSLVDMTKIKVSFRLLESDVIAVNKGDRVNVVIPALNNLSVIGEVAILAPAFQSSDPGFLVEVLIDNNDAQLKPGMQARVEVMSKGNE